MGEMAGKDGALGYRSRGTILDVRCATELIAYRQEDIAIPAPMDASERG